MRTLDRTRTFGEVYPTGGFEQDGLQFGPDGNELPGQEGTQRKPPVVPGAAKFTGDDAVATVLSDPEALAKLQAQLLKQQKPAADKPKG